MKYLTLFVLPVSFLLCACQPSSNSSETPNSAKPTDSTIKVIYKPVSINELFNQRFNKVDVVCDIFALDQSDVKDSDKPQGSIRLPVFPNANVSSGQAVLSPSGQLKVEVKLNEPEMASFDFKIDNQIAGQTPVVILTGQIAGSYKLHGSNANQTITSNIDTTLFSMMKGNMPSGSVAIQDNTANGQQYAEVGKIDCHLETEPAKAPL